MEKPDALEQLFATPLDGFVAARERLASELARDGKKEEGQTLKKVRRPSPSAWATNQVVRQARPAIDEFLAVSARLRRTQDALLAGRGDQAAYQAGVEELRVATAALTKAAREVLARSGRGDDRHVVERVISNVRTAALAAERRPDLLAAQLTSDLEAGEEGFAGMLAGAAATRPAAPPRAVPVGVPPRTRAEPGKRGQGDERARRQQEERARRKEERARGVVAARREEDEATGAAARAEATAAAATSAREEARGRLREAERAATAARGALRDAEADVQRAQKELTAAAQQARAATRRRETLEKATRDD